MDEFYYFPPWRKQFYFSAKLIDNKRGIKYFYQPYIAVSKVAWLLWTGLRAFRKLFKVTYDQLPNAFQVVYQQLGLNGYTFQINEGTRGPEQKMTVLAYHDNGNQIFIKAGHTSSAKKLIANEANALNLLTGKLLVPAVVNFFDDDALNVLVTSVINADKLIETALNEKLFSYIVNVAKVNDITIKDDLFCSLAHGDCCPWNFLVNADESVVLIDWELSQNYPLGYDLFTFIFQTAFLLQPKKEISQILSENETWIARYFMVLQITTSYTPYLFQFVNIKIGHETLKGHSPLLAKLSLLKAYLNN